jgi:hypothetical protein
VFQPEHSDDVFRLEHYDDVFQPEHSDDVFRLEHYDDVFQPEHSDDVFRPEHAFEESRECSNRNIEISLAAVNRPRIDSE